MAGKRKKAAVQTMVATEAPVKTVGKALDLPEPLPPIEGVILRESVRMFEKREGVSVPQSAEKRWTKLYAHALEQARSLPFAATRSKCEPIELFSKVRLLVHQPDGQAPLYVRACIAMLDYYARPTPITVHDALADLDTLVRLAYPECVS